MSNCVFFSIRALSLLKKNKEENTVTYQESPPWLPTMFKTSCIETILYQEFSRSNKQGNISGRIMDAENHRLLLTSSPAYYNLFITFPSLYASPSPRFPRLRVPRLRVPCLRVPRLQVPRLRVPRPRVPVPTSQSTRPSPHVPVPTSQSPRPCPHVSVILLVTANN